jgi:hypothetical protein
MAPRNGIDNSLAQVLSKRITELEAKSAGIEKAKADIKADIDVVRNRCNNVLQIAGTIDNFVAVLTTIADKTGFVLSKDETTGAYKLEKKPAKKTKK